ncbi:hypothetical protein AB0442_13455 [Kitasatospora sp. NPDC085895]|uniref:hypothetical protein n=1 Tax=Kitasatospora sp. NPDC085895 TaxID=3155057 RepID=UPI00345094E8
MTYNLLLTGDLDHGLIAAGLAEQFGLPTGEVDVAGADDYDNRNWDAVVSCTYERVLGDVTWALDIHAAADRPGLPSESQLAAGLAGRLGRSVLFPAQESLPSAYWLAAPGGLVTRARLLIDDEDEVTYTIDAVEQAVPDLPSTPVQRQPEVIREHRPATPATDAFAAWLTEHEHSRGHGTDPAEEEAEWYARTRLGAWESLAERMAAAWRPDDWYPADFYHEDLEVRDQLVQTVAALPQEVSARAAEALASIDEVFREHTVDDKGTAVSEALGLPRLDVALRSWWWQRRPNPLPWSS